ncbi:discoidin, CUB and LCCL domain-containing protein 2 [Boleophthalmus pectinirostris]|uniref:discoidin, CUB and LCCL domain-containing protein 2 n=1 Tax=Boleophthalmus pectinirostris TaxID=150288 RepID=UPI000A1C3B16|nr:discoidin, CUB and LCCL domain-containing protein 2 [Boleophthalmus pectinirostris]
MGRVVMVGRGPTRAGGLVLSILIIFTTEGCRAQKGDGCGPSLLGPTSGTLSSLGYPRTYPNNTVCEWEITVPRGNRIHFRFAELDIENDCQVNYLRLYDGIGPDRSEIAKYCGSGLKLEQLIESSGHQVTVQFMSGTHHRGRGFYLSFSLTEHTDLITCLDKGADFPEAEFSKYCPAGCLTSKEEISGTIPNGYRESSPLCIAAIHAGVVSNAVGGKIHVVSSKGIPHYEGTLANNVTSTGGTLSDSLFTFKTSGCSGTLGLGTSSVADSQFTASSVWEWNGKWAPTGARLKSVGRPWAPAHNDQQQFLQVDLKRERNITGIITTGSTMREYQYYVSAYRVLYSYNGQQWQSYRETNSTKDKVFQGNNNFLHEVRNNFIPPIEARFLRINPLLWHQRIALKLELFGCPIPSVRAGPRMMAPFHPTPRSKRPPRLGVTTATPDIRNTTMPPHSENGMAMIAVLVPVLAIILTGLILTVVCACHCRNRKQSTDGTYDLPHWDRTDWWKSMKQLLPSKMVDTDETVRYSSSEVGRLTGRGAVPILHAEPAEYAQPLVSGVTTLGARSTFKPDEGPEPGYSDPDLYDAPMSHPYAEPLPASGAEYATPIVVDMSSFMVPSSMLTKPETAKLGRSAYDTPKNVTGQVTPTEDLTYQVPQNSTQKS